MKPFSFLCTKWKKDTKSSTPALHTPSPSEHMSTDGPPVSNRYPKTSPGKRMSILCIRINSTAQIQNAPAQESAKPKHGNHKEFLAEKSHHHPAPAPPGTSRGHRVAPQNPSHRPPRNLSNGQPNLMIMSHELESKNLSDLSGSSTSLVPPCAPFLNPWSHSSNQSIDRVSIPQLPRVTFASTSQSRSSRSVSASHLSSCRAEADQMNFDDDPVLSAASSKDTSVAFHPQGPESCYSQDSESLYSQESTDPSYSPKENPIAITLKAQDNMSPKCEHLDPTTVFINDTELNSRLLDEKSGYAVVELRNPSYHATATPHLPFSEPGASQMKSEYTRDEIASSLAGLSSSAPLVFHKRPAPLVLLPNHNMKVKAVRPSTSPGFSSANSTPLVTPGSYSSISGRPHSLSPMKNTLGRTFHRMSPPTSSPPNSPLPTPPITPSYNAPTTTVVGRTRTLRSAQSTTDLRDLRDLRVERRKLSSAHGSSSSASTSRKHFLVDDSRANSRPESFATTAYLVRFFMLYRCHC